MNCLIVDDDEIARKAVEQCVSRTEFLTLSGSCASVPEALTLIRKQKIDLIFLDVEMPEMSGLDFLRTFKEIPQIILITGKKEYAAEAFDYDVTDFLLKPIDYARFLKAAMRAQNIQDNLKPQPEGEEDALFIKKEGARFLRLPMNEIIWVEALADYVQINTKDGRHTILSTMKSIESRLPQRDFVRIHRSYIVRLDKIQEIEENSVNVGGKSLPVSRSHKEDLFNRLNLL
ncbi:MAG: LytTR family DNA-binding domain-containing protein [Bacteroidia bacterium]|jgi:DNA-binding LytR/AlgR family response regulator|nr:LytTR family DNA-binding domain-containing protein [Bacteroidia bacterium]